MKRAILALISVSMFLISAGGGSFRALAANQGTSAGNAPPGKYALIAWNDLGMHCMDNNYAVFAILPPYNNLHAQLINRLTGKPVTSGVTIT